jgi:hypothetical protein
MFGDDACCFSGQVLPGPVLARDVISIGGEGDNPGIEGKPNPAAFEGPGDVKGPVCLCLLRCLEDGRHYNMSVLYLPTFG